MQLGLPAVMCEELGARTMHLEPWPLEHKAIGKEISMNDAFFAAGKDWELGPDWLGVRCGAKTRKGTSLPEPRNERQSALPQPRRQVDRSTDRGRASQAECTALEARALHQGRKG